MNASHRTLPRIIHIFALIYLIFCLIGLSGCPAPVIKNAKPPPDIIKEYKSVVVWAKILGMVDTGVDVKRGDSVTILAEGEINVWPARPGFSRKPSDNLFIRVGKDNFATKYVGQELTPIHSDGHLYLGYAGSKLDKYGEPQFEDRDYYRDDIGQFAVDIIVWKTNDPTFMAKFFEEASQRDPQKSALKEISTKFEKRKELFVAEQKAKKELAETEKAITALQREEVSKPKAAEKSVVVPGPNVTAPEGKEPQAVQAPDREKQVSSVSPKPQDEKKPYLPAQEKEIHGGLDGSYQPPQQLGLLADKDTGEKEKMIAELNERLQKAKQALRDVEEMKERMTAQLAEQQKKEAEVSARLETLEIEKTKQIKNISTITGTKWAAIIGISKYKDTRIPSLRYAAADAKSFYDWAISPDGGKYAPAMVKLLIDADATGANIKTALFDWLAQAIQEDTVTLFFAGHGSPQSPDHPENLFLLAHDTQYDSISTTGFPMWDIETALKRFIKAKKVIVITDACHAGGVGRAFDIARRDGRGLKTITISSSLQSLSTISDGVCIISASDDNQFSQEGLQWGQGHGVFTYYLLEGLKGKADYNKDGLVTLGELIPFLSEQVRRETRNAQTPTVAGRFDPALSIGK
jgi:hypothetical protein